MKMGMQPVEERFLRKGEDIPFLEVNKRKILERGEREGEGEGCLR
jgi:hypothetical protein